MSKCIGENKMKKILAVLLMVFGIGCAAFAKPVTVNKTVVVDDTLTLKYLTYDKDYSWSGVECYESCEQEDNDFFFNLMMDIDKFFDMGVTYRIGVYTYDDNGNVLKKRILLLERLTDSFFEATWRWAWFDVIELE